MKKIILSVVVAFATLSAAHAQTRSGLPAQSNPVDCTANSGTNICVTQAPYYASTAGATTTTVSGTFGIGTSGSVASCSTFLPHQGVLIAGAGTSAANYVGTVVSCNSTTLTVTPNTVTSVSSSNVVQHDESAAFQAAITALASTGGNIYIPDGKYLLNGPLQDTSGANAILVMPHLALANSTVTRFIGFKEPASLEVIPQPTGAVIQTSATSGSLFGGFCSSCGLLNFTFAGLQMENLTLIAPTNPSISVINAFWLGTARFYHVSVGTTNIASVPSNTTSFGIVFPAQGNDVRLSGQDLYVSGFATCVQLGEHTTITELGESSCIKGIVPQSRSGAPYAGNMAHVVHAWIQSSTYGLAAGPQLAAVKIDIFDLENVGTNGIYDPTNLMYGDVGFNIQSASGAITPTNPAVNSASNLCIHNLQFPNGTTYGGACPTSGGVSSYTGDGTLVSNSSSTGPVTVTLANAAGHKFFGNNTSSTAAPGYDSIGYADLPSLSANALLGALTGTTPSGLAVPSCSGASSALTWTSGSGFGCNTISGGSGGGMSGWSVLTVTTFGTSATQYTPFVGGGVTSTTESVVQLKAPAAATLSNLQVALSASLGIGTTFSVTLRNAGSSTALTCTSASSGTVCQDLTHSVNVAQNDLLDFQIVATGTVTAGIPTIQIGYAVGTSGVGVTAVTGTAPIASSGGSTPAISCSTCLVNNAETHTVASATEIDFTSCFSSSYKFYQIRGTLTGSSNSVFVYLQFSTNGGSTWDTSSATSWGKNYASIYTPAAGGNSSGNTSNGGMDLSGGGSANLNNALYPFTFNMVLIDPLSTSAYKMMTGQVTGNYATGTPNNFLGNDGWNYQNTNAVNAARIYIDGSVTMTGTVTCQPVIQ